MNKKNIFLIFLVFLSFLPIYILGGIKTPGAIISKVNFHPQKAVAVSNPPSAHVFLVVLENQSYGSVIGNENDMPYFNDLARKYSLADNYYANTHPSLGNYLMLTTGQVLTKKNSFSGTISDDNIVRSLGSSTKSWKEYSENLPNAGYWGENISGYTRHHNPLSYFSDVRDHPDQLQNLVPLSQLATDLNNNSLPNFALIVPNNKNNGHDCPSGGHCGDGEKLAAADKWLRNNIDPLLNNSQFQNEGGIVIITFDEANKFDRINGGGHVAWILAGPNIKQGYSSGNFYQHENTLRFILESLGVNNFPGASRDAQNMNEFYSGN